MLTITDHTLLVGAAELRKEMPQITKAVKEKTVIITKKGKPIAVLEDFDEYTQKNRIIETFEDIILGYLAKERFEKSKKSDYIPHEKMVRKFGVES